MLQCLLTETPANCLHSKATLWGNVVQGPWIHLIASAAACSPLLSCLISAQMLSCVPLDCHRWHRQGKSVSCRVAGSLAIISLVLWVPLGSGGLLARPAQLPTDEERHSAVRWDTGLCAGALQCNLFSHTVRQTWSVLHAAASCGTVPLLLAADLHKDCSLLAGMCGRQGRCLMQLPAAAHCC